jgi:hypothetical protein
MPKLYTKQMTYGLNQPLLNVPFAPVLSTIDPTVNDRYEIGQLWTNTVLNTAWMLTSYQLGLPVWTEIDNDGAITQVVWTTEAGAVINLANNHGYVLTNGAVVTALLPGVSPVGSVIEIICQGTTDLTISQNAGQQLIGGGLASTVGVGGGVLTSVDRQSIQIVTRTANTTFQVVSFDGNLNFI